MVLMFLMKKNRLRDRFPDEEEEGASDKFLKSIILRKDGVLYQ